jgi:hypothetical protein
MAGLVLSVQMISCRGWRHCTSTQVAAFQQWTALDSTFLHACCCHNPHALARSVSQVVCCLQGTKQRSSQLYSIDWAASHVHRPAQQAFPRRPELPGYPAAARRAAALSWVCELTVKPAHSLLAGSVSRGRRQAFSIHQHTEWSTGLCHSGPNLQDNAQHCMSGRLPQTVRTCGAQLGLRTLCKVTGLFRTDCEAGPGAATVVACVASAQGAGRCMVWRPTPWHDGMD